MKKFFAFFINDGVYHLYKFSIHSIDKIKLVKAGLAHDNHGEYSKEFKAVLEEYKPLQGMHDTASDREDFLSRIYLDSKQTKMTVNPIDLHKSHYEIVKYIYESQRAKKKKDGAYMVDEVIEILEVTPDQERIDFAKKIAHSII